MPPHVGSDGIDSTRSIHNVRKRHMGNEGADTPAVVIEKYGGASVEGPIIQTVVRPQQNKEDRCIIGVKGHWYDVTNFVSKHPGGDILLDFHNKDCTFQFLAYHDDRLLERKFKYLDTKKTYEWNVNAPDVDSLDAVYLALNKEFTEKGYFKTDTQWIINRFAVTAFFLLMNITMALTYAYTGSHIAFYVGSVFLAAFFQQCGFHMHDHQHRHVFHDRTKDGFCGWLFAAVGFGVSPRWWRDEHNEHHVFTNSVVPGVGCADPQMTEDVWAQSPLLFPYYNQRFLSILLSIQHIVFLPILVFFGYFFIKLDSYMHEKRPLDAFGCVLYWVWVIGLLSTFPSWWDALLYYYLASCMIGVLEIQLLVSHYSEDFVEKDTAKSMSWMRRQISCVTDIDCPEWMDWFFGGLHLHCIHHLFPRMCRQHYRAAMPSLIRALQAQGLEIKHTTFYGAICETLAHLKNMNELFSMDPR